MYFLQKEGAYYHGVFWIGTYKEEGIEAAKEAARNDRDALQREMED